MITSHLATGGANFDDDAARGQRSPQSISPPSPTLLHFLQSWDPTSHIRINRARSSIIPTEFLLRDTKVFLESIHDLAPPTNILNGTALVRNVAFEKLVQVRFTDNRWAVASQISLTHQSRVASLPRAFRAIIDESPGGWDRFDFYIKTDGREPWLAYFGLDLALKYEVRGVGEWWDNNGGSNYQIYFTPYLV